MAFKYFDYPLPDFLISSLVGMELRFTKRVEQPKTHTTKILLFIIFLLIDTNSSMWGKVIKFRSPPEMGKMYALRFVFICSQ